MKSYIKVITTILLFLSTLSLRAQTDSVRGRATSSLTLASALLDPITLPASLDQDVERLLERWYSGYGQHKGVRVIPPHLLPSLILLIACTYVC